MNHTTTPAAPANAEEGRRINAILDHAEFCGMQEDFRHPGNFIELWTLIKVLPPHPKGSTISRQTLDRLLFSGNFRLRGGIGRRSGSGL